MKIALVNPFDKLPGEDFRDQRYTYLYNKLKIRHQVKWISSDFHHWTHSRRKSGDIPSDDIGNIVLISTISYNRNISFKRLLSHFFFSFRALKWLNGSDFNPDLIICVAPVESMYLFARHARSRRIRIILDALDLWPDLFIKPFPTFLRWLGRFIFFPYYWMSRRAFQMADHITSVSKTYTAWALERGSRSDRGNSSFYYLGGGITPGSYNHDKPRDKMLCLFAGQLGFNYDVETIVRAAKVLEQTGCEQIEFIIAGDGYKRSQLESMAKGLTNISFLGWVPFERLAGLARQCHVGLNCYVPQATQSVPTKLFDYLSMGLYVVNSLSGETTAILVDSGVGTSYCSGDPRSLADALLGMLPRLDEICRSGERARDIFCSSYQADIIYDKMIAEIIECHDKGAIIGEKTR